MRKNKKMILSSGNKGYRWRWYCMMAVLVLVATACHKSDNMDSPAPVNPLPYNYKNDRLAAGTRFDSVSVFTTAQIDSVSGLYGSNRDYQNVVRQLPFTFYAPKLSLDTMTRRPFIMLIHGGGFISGSYTSLQAVARSFAARGYAAATIEYRLGFNVGAIPCINGDSIEVLKAVYRATQDANAAMRYFVSNAATLGIDTAQLFLFGSSAGNVTSTSMLYSSQAFYDSKISGLQASLGGLNNATNTLTNFFRIQAEITATGYGLVDRSFITTATAKPTFYMQGSVDATLPPDYGPAFQCPLGTYGHTYGSTTAKNLLKPLRFPYEQYLAEGYDHDVSGAYPSTMAIPRMAAFIKRLWKADYRQIEYKTQVQTYNQVVQ